MSILSTVGKNYIGVSSMLTENQRSAAITKAAEEAEREKNQGGFWGGLGYVFEKVGLGFLSGVEGIWDYTAGGLAKLFGADDWAEQQFANDWVNYNHADEWFNPSEGWQTAGDVASGIGTSLPAVLGVAAAGAIAYFSGGSLSGVSAGIISGVIAGFGAAGNATKEAYRETGELGGKEFGYGALVGITEGTIEGVSGAIGAGTGAVTKNIAKSFGKEVGETAVRQTLGKTIIKGFVGEAFEEGVATLIDPVWKRITYDPDAKNATFEEVAYASLVGGLAGAIMGGGDVSVRNFVSTIRGNKLLGEGRANDVIATAENISQTAIEQETTTAPTESSADTTTTPTETTAETTSETDTTAGAETNDATPEYESFKLVKSILSELKTSMQKTNGQIVNAHQKMLLGYLEQANTAAAFEPFIATSAENIYNNAEAVAERMNAYGYTDPNGKPITYTAEQLRAGIDTSSPRAFRRSMSKALRTNSALRGLAIVDATGRLTLDTSRFADATLRGQRLSSQVDLNRFIETADENELRAVGEKLGIESWETLTNEEFQGKITKFVQDGGVETYKNERILACEVESVDPTTAKKTLPRMVNLRADGTYRYTQGNTDIAIVKRGDSYRIYDYSSKRMSKSLTRTEVNKTLKEIHANEANYTESARQFVERQSEIVRRTAEIDAYARENIPDYTKLNAPNQSIIRSIIRQGRAAGVSEDFVLSCARISARSGLNIVFSKEMSFVAANGTYADGAIDLKRNRIIVNPEAKNRTGEMILIHELTHAIYKLDGSVLQVAEGLETMTADEKEKIRKRYAAIGQGSAIEVSDEINAHFAEQTLANKNILERLAIKKPSLKQKILAFFKGAKSDYQGDAKLTGAAARLYKQYKKLFDEFAAKNQQRNAVETGTSTTSYALSDSLRTLSAYSDAEITSIERNADFSVARSYEDVRDFIDNVEKFDRDKSLFLGKIGDKNAAKILTETGVDVKGKSIVLNSSNLRHIFNNHGNAASEALSGQIAVTKNNIESVIETLVEPDSVERSDENGKVGIMFKKNINGRVMAITILSEKKKALTLKSAWIIKNKQHISPTDNASALPSTSKTGKSMNTVYSNSISETTEKVNPKTAKTTKKFALSLESIEEKYKNQAKVLLLTENKGSVSIRNLVVEPEQRNKGVGQAILDDIVAYADAKSKIITLTPTSEYGTKKRLISWYKKNGFVENKGKNTEFTISDTMYRLPLSNKKFALPAENSDGEHLSDAQRVFFAKSKVVDKQGRLIALYNGVKTEKNTESLDYGYTYHFLEENLQNKDKPNRFGFFFTDNKGTAEEYSTTWFSKTQTAGLGRVNKVYLNLKKPLDLRTLGLSCSEKEFYKFLEQNGVITYRSRYKSDYKPVWRRFDSGGENLRAQIQAAGYDGVVYHDWGEYGSSYVAFYPNQIKLTTNKKPSKQDDIRYALEIDGETTPVDVEEGRNLVALHNLSEDKLLRVIELGGFPMPSIAVTTTDLPHENYGSLTVVFGRETIDPETDYRNVVYDRDAWTPTTPTVDVKLSNEAVDALIKELQDKVKGYSAYERNIFSFFDGKYRTNNGDYIVSDMDYTKESFGERAIRSSGIVAAYLSEKGVNVEPVYAERGFTMGWSSFTRKEATELFDFVGITKDITRDNATQEQRDAILEKFIEYRAKERLGLMRRFKKDKTLTIEQVKEILRGEYDDGHVSQLFFMAEDFFNEKRPKDIYDEYATLEKMQSEITDKQDFFDWFWNKVESTFEKKGIDNDSDVFDSRGNRRSFEQRHYSYTAANIVRAMQHGDQEGNIPLGMTAGALAAKLSKRFDSIEDIREAKEYLALVSEEDLKAFNDKTYELYDELVTTIAGRTSDFMSDSSRRDDVGDILGKCAAVKPLTIENIKRKFSSETRGYNLGYKFNDQIAEQALLLFESLKHIPTTYFEAKPRRVVGFGEIKTVLIPETASDKLKTQLSKKKIKWQVYGEGENARSEIIKTMDDVKFALPQDEEYKGYDYDGLILDEGGDGGYGEAVSLRGESYVIFKPEQAKLTTNTKPTNNSDFRFALDDTDSDVRGNYTVGQRARFAANNTGMRVYSRAEAADVINSIIEERLVLEEYGMYGELKGKDREAAIDYLFTKLNTTKEGYRAGVALKIADFMIEHTVLTDMYAEESVGDAMQILSILRSYMHRIDLAQIRADVQHRFDKKNTIELVWGQKGGIAPDTLGQLLAEEGIHLDAINGADMFFQMYDMYVEARDTVNAAAKKVMLSSFGSQADIESLRQAIARDVLIAYDSRGKKSKFAKLVEKYTAEIARLKQRVRDLQAENRLLNSIVDKAQKMKDLKLGTFLNSTQFKSDVFKQSIEKLARIKNRGNFNIAGTRKIIAELRTWYTKENPLLADNYEQGIADMLDTIAAGTKNYTTDELKMINNVMAYFTNFVEKFNKVYRQGKWVEAIPEATRYIDVIHENETVKVGLFRKLSGSTYMQTFGDPMTVARRMDMYENGFYTEMLQELREAAIDAEVSEMEVKADYEEFMRKHKKYLSQISKEKVKYQGVEIPKTHLIGLYMTLKRSQSHAGLVFNGFSFIDTDGKKVRVQGLAPDITTDLELIQVVARETAALESMMSATDKEYIAILEKGYNTDAKKLKADRDMQRLGFTNATEGYYYPIRRGNIAKNVDTSDVQGELDRVSNSSFNKDTVRGAKQELFIESADIVYNRHIHAVCQYAALSPAIETYNRLYNLDISGNPNKPISVATESANTWAKGNKYFAKLISDIQGIPSSSSEGMRALSFIRGSYAKFQLGANPKVWITQLSSLFSASSILDADSITKGMFISAKGIDDYCSLAKLRNSDNTAAMAQGVIDKVGKFSNFFMAPIGKMDRFVVRRLFGACQVQVEKNGGAKVGTEANKVEAGKLLRKVILETQQNSMATERSAAMRSGNEIMRTLTMFTSDSMKVIGRVIDSIGELSTLRAKLKMTTDPDVQARLKNQIKAAHTKVRKSVTALVLTALFMAGIAQLFRWLYNKDQDEDETVAETIIVDFVGNLFGGLPLIKDVYARLVEGYDVDNYAYSAVNDLLDSASGLFEAVKKIVSDEATSQDIASSVKSLTYSVGQMFGIPTRNLYNVFYGLTKRISPTTAYQIDNVFYKKNYTNDLNKAIENEDDEMAAMLLSLVLNERVGDEMSDSVRETLSRLYKDGYSVLPRTINGSIIYNNETIELNDAELSRFKSVYTQANKYVETMVNSKGFKSLSAEQQAKAIKQLYDAYYYKAISDLLKTDANTTIGKLSKWISVDKLSVAFAALSGIESDKDDDGKTISGSRKKKIVEGLMKQNLSDGERLLILCYKGYSIQNGDYKGYTAKRAKHILLKYILSLKNTSQAEKAAIAEQCGFEVKNGRIVRESLYTTNK